MVNDLDNQQYNITNLHSLLGLVSKELDFFNRPVPENITYGLLGADNETLAVTDATLEIAAKQTKCHDFIANLSDNYEPIIDRRDERLSGVAISRTLLRQPTMVLLHEASTASDSVAEKEVQK